MIKEKDLKAKAIELTADYFGITVEGLKSKDRIKNGVKARRFVSLLLLDASFTLKAIGRELQRNHTVILKYKKDYLAGKVDATQFDHYIKFMEQEMHQVFLSSSFITPRYDNKKIQKVLDQQTLFFKNLLNKNIGVKITKDFIHNLFDKS